MAEIKQAIIVRTDIKMGVGKLAAQVAHASLMSYFECAKKDGDVAAEWLREGEKKIVLKVADEKDLEKLFAAFKFKKIPCALVSDAGLTQVPPGTKTALGIGPWNGAEIDAFTSALKLL
jgi:peptidyl-tRNA hydrolase, PTH2 family